MKRVDLLITEARNNTENSEYTSETGVQDSEFLRAMNDAQDRIMSLVLQTNPSILKKDKEVTAVVATEAQDLPADLFAQTQVELIKYSRTGLFQDYYKLNKYDMAERLNSLPGDPTGYVLRGSQALLQPRPQQAGLIRYTYYRTIPRLDKRRGKVSAVTLDSVNLTIDNLVIDPSILTTDDAQALNDAEYFCVVDKNGNIKMEAVELSEVNSSTGLVTIESGFTYQSGETIAVGDYLVSGKYATTHSELPDIAERYLLKFCDWRMLKRDSSNDSREQKEELNEMESDIVGLYAKNDFDVTEVPILDASILEF